MQYPFLPANERIASELLLSISKPCPHPLLQRSQQLQEAFPFLVVLPTCTCYPETETDVSLHYNMVEYAPTALMGRETASAAYSEYMQTEKQNAPLALFVPAYEERPKVDDCMVKESTSSIPPALPRRLPIRLPPLSPNIPIQTHPLITYHHTHAECFDNVPVIWNISSGLSAARLRSSALSHYEGDLTWLGEPALKPELIDSMVIRLPSIGQLVVVFPIHTGFPIRIKDVFRAISGLLNATITRNTAQLTNLEENPDLVEAIAAGESRSDFLRKAYWGGLYECPEEQDVWILQLHHLEQRRERM